MPVEGNRAVVDGIYDDGARAELTGPGHRPDKCIDQQIGTEPGALLVSVQRQPGKEQHGHGIGLTPSKSRRSRPMLDAAHCQREVADYPSVPREHPGRCSTGRGCNRCGSHQPLVEHRYPAVEMIALVPGRVEQLDGT